MQQEIPSDFELMLDIETLDTAHSAVVLSVAVVPFTHDGVAVPGRGFYLRLDTEEQFRMGRTVSADTLAFWAKQDDDVRREALQVEAEKASVDLDVPDVAFLACPPRRTDGKVVDVEMALLALAHWYDGLRRPARIWSKGPSFDEALMQSLAHDVGLRLPWDFRSSRDCRTLCDWLSREDRMAVAEELKHLRGHHPLDDCVWQIAELRHARRRLGIG